MGWEYFQETVVGMVIRARVYCDQDSGLETASFLLYGPHNSSTWQLMRIWHKAASTLRREMELATLPSYAGSQNGTHVTGSPTWHTFEDCWVVRFVLIGRMISGSNLPSAKLSLRMRRFNSSSLFQACEWRGMVILRWRTWTLIDEQKSFQCLDAYLWMLGRTHKKDAPFDEIIKKTLHFAKFLRLHRHPLRN